MKHAALNVAMSNSVAVRRKEGKTHHNRKQDLSSN
jgi:hypothetical protein